MFEVEMLTPGSTAKTDISTKRALIVGLGGLGCPAAMALARAGIGQLHICDDDQVAESNLHRQVLFDQDDVGRDKLDAAKPHLLALGAREVILHRSRLLPENAQDLVRGQDIVIEGADNFATKFLAADACYLEHVPLVHGAAIRFIGTALLIKSEGAPCYRCLFEDLLSGKAAPSCDSAGVMGPVVGVVGALLADLALDALRGDWSRSGQIFNFDGKSLQLRAVSLRPRPSCSLCGTATQRPIRQISRALYVAP